VIFIRACVPALLKSDAARIINIASTEHFVTGPGNAAYSATKSAVTGLTRAFAVELGKYQNITVSCANILYEMRNIQSDALDALQVNTICPGPIIVSSQPLVPFLSKSLT
jgi:NAD(P)-dependent dehydrogenase (short-subunit alcohol dehydrogenase family)